jgi:site-specific DNA-cytosine methylase
MQSLATDTVFTMATPFGGCGGGAFGGQKAVASFRGMRGRTSLVGGYDSDPYACAAFKYLTGVEEACVDARALVPSDILAMWGPEAPFAIVSSPPCVGATALISHAKASTEHYVEMNGLMLPSTQTILEAYGPDPLKLPAYFIFENVPGLGSERRGGKMLKKLFALFASYGCFQIHAGHHNARTVGGGAQNRVRLLIIVRNIARVPVFLYKPPVQEGLVVGDVIGPLPLPDDPRGGPMHRTTKRMSFLNRLRLWAIEAGKDWRSLRDRRDALAMQVPPGAHANLYRVADEDGHAPTVTCATRPGGGALSVADSRIPVDLAPKDANWHPNVLGVLDPNGHSGVITGEGRPTNGSFSVAAVVPVDLMPQAGNPNLHENKYVVLPYDGHAKSVTTATRVGSGAMSVAQPIDLATADSAFHHGAGPGRWGVLTPLDPSGAVTANARPTTGPYSVAAPVPVDLVPPKGCFDAGYGVLDTKGHARAIASTSAVGCGAYAVAVPVDLVPQGVDENPERAARYGVLRRDQTSRTITATSRVGCGAYAVADDVPRKPVRLELGCAPRAGAYGVQRFDEAGKTVLAQGSVDNTVAAVADPRETPRYVILSCEQVERIVSGEIPVPFAIVDPERPDVPLAIVDDLTKPAYRLERKVGPRGRILEHREPVTVVLVSRDGMWHREMTTLELAALQHFPWMHRGVPLDFGGGVTEQRSIIGNAIPSGVMEAVFGQIMISALASAQSFFLAPSDWDVWVQGLRDDGYEVITAGHGPVTIGGGVVLDDGAVLMARDDENDGDAEDEADGFAPSAGAAA